MTLPKLIIDIRGGRAFAELVENGPFYIEKKEKVLIIENNDVTLTLETKIVLKQILFLK